MKKIFGIGLVVLLFGVIGYRVLTHGEEPAIKDIDAFHAEMGIPVEVQAVQRENLTITRTFTGTIEGERQADAISNTTQKLVAVHVRAGDRVKAGQVVAELDTDIASNMTLRYSQSLANLEAAEKDLNRMKTLYKAGAVSEQAYDRVVLQHEISMKNYDAASKVVHIQAPISGIVTHVYFKEGETVHSGQPVAKIARLNEVLIEIDINETEIAGIQNGQGVLVTLAAYPNKQFKGRLEDLSLSADPVSRTFKAWVRVENSDLLLRPGMFAKIKVFVTAREGVLTISKDAIIEKENKKMVYVVNSEKVADLREVQMGETSGNLVEILSGLDENELVVVLGRTKLQPGKKVNVVRTGS